MRLSKPTGTITEEVVFPSGTPAAPSPSRPGTLTVPLVRAGEHGRRPNDLAAARALVADGLEERAVGGPEAFARGTGDPDPDRDAVAQGRGNHDGQLGCRAAGHAVAALGGSERERPDRHGRKRWRTPSSTGEHLAVQAGTGTGKSLAYLVPAMAAALADDDDGDPVAR